MKLTEEQLAVVNSEGDIKINAVAGSGKTSTILEYAASKPSNSRILYLAFNRSVKLEAIKKFSEKNLFNVKIETAHSLAYRKIVLGSEYAVSKNGYNAGDIADMLKIRKSSETNSEFIIANHIKKFFSFFCNSNAKRVQDLNYAEAVSDAEAIDFVKKNYVYIENLTREFLNLMNNRQIDITHDFYLKKYQLSNPVLDFDFILFDEGQDASSAMLDIFLNQNAGKVIAGDTHQQIYGWRFAVNSLESTNFKELSLSSSFRFRQDIADLAAEIIKYKKHINNYKGTIIKGLGSCDKKNSKAVLARSNLGLLQKAIEFVTENQNPKYIYFEGNFNSYTYADDGASLYDVLHLYNARHNKIRDKIIKSMKSIAELEIYSRKIDDIQLGMMIDIVKKYRNEIPGILREIKNMHVRDHEKEKAEMIFSTVHRCKGMEYDEVILANDFMTEVRLKKLAKESMNNSASLSKLNEEINLMYVAVTRTKNILNIPESLLPGNFKNTPHIRVIYSSDKNKETFDSRHKRIEDYSNDIYKKNYSFWTKERDKKLLIMFDNGTEIKEIAKYFGCNIGEIYDRLEWRGMYID